MTLVEIMVAMFFASGVCAGLYQVGWQARRHAEYARLATEARELAKEKLEEILSYDLNDLRSSSYWWNTETNFSSTGAPILRQARAVWHAADASVTESSTGVYAEIHVDVAFRSPLWNAIATNTFSTIVQ
ncbi:MAG: hypothetical protein R6X19_06525 [Kiritimatiellia bacterium]